MLGRTQALEDRLLALNAERNALEAEAARMPSHTNGRTLKVGGGRVWVCGAPPQTVFSPRRISINQPLFY